MNESERERDEERYNKSVETCATRIKKIKPNNLLSRTLFEFESCHGERVKE